MGAKKSTSDYEGIRAIAKANAARIEELHASHVGSRSSHFAQTLEAELGITIEIAREIALAETLKTNAREKERRQRESGITHYIWSAGADDRVRPMHAALDGRVFAWDDPPITNPQGERHHPGMDFQCRCGAVPLMPGDDEEDDISKAARAAIRGRSAPPLSAVQTRTQSTQEPAPQPANDGKPALIVSLALAFGSFVVAAGAAGLAPYLVITGACATIALSVARIAGRTSWPRRPLLAMATSAIVLAVVISRLAGA